MIVAPVRALLQRLGPAGAGRRRWSSAPGSRSTSATLLPELVAKGYRREHQVEHRGEFAVRGGIVDVFPSTADVPVRIDLWGDEVDRLTAFAVSDQRSSRDLDAVALYGCRELVAHRRSCAPRPTALVARPALGRVGVGAPGARASSSTAWSRGCPSSTPTSACCPTCSPAGAQVVLVEPRRIRDRGAQLLDEEAALAETLAATWGAKEGDGGRLPPPARPLRAPAARLPGRGHRPAAGPRGALDAPRSRCAASTRWRGTRPAWPPG